MERKRSVRRQRKRKTFAKKCREYCRQFIAFLFSNVGIILLVVSNPFNFTWSAASSSWLCFRWATRLRAPSFSCTSRSGTTWSWRSRWTTRDRCTPRSSGTWRWRWIRSTRCSTGTWWCGSWRLIRCCSSISPGRVMTASPTRRLPRSGVSPELFCILWLSLLPLVSTYISYICFF